MPPPAFTYRPLAAADLPMLHEWLRRPHVAQWWGPTSWDELVADYQPTIDAASGTRCHIAEFQGAPFGFIQSYVAVESHADGWWLDEHDAGVVGLDQFLADGASLGRGLGTAMITGFVERLLEDPRVTRVQVDPAPANARAIRCYEKCGFRRVREVDTPDGRALLMYRDR